MKCILYNKNVFKRNVQEADMKNCLHALFDKQVNKILSAGYLEIIPESLKIDRKKFLDILSPLKERLNSVEYEHGNIPFLIVFPNEFLEIEKQIPLISVDGVKAVGRSFYNLRKNTDECVSDCSACNICSDCTHINEIRKPYLCIDIETDYKEKWLLQSDYADFFKKRKRFGLTLEEGVALVLHYPEVLKKHFLEFSGSRCDDRHTPNAQYFKSYRGEFRLWFCYHYRNFVDEDFRAPSCRKRAFIE